MKTLIVAISICLLFACCANAEQATIAAKASTDSVRVAEPLSLELRVTADAGTKVQFPAVGQRLGDFEVIEMQDLFDIPSATSADQRTWTRRMTLESIVTGDLTIPPQEIQIANDVTTKTLESETIPVRVLSVLENRADLTQFRDIHSVIDVDVPQTKSNAWIWYTVSGIGGLSLAIAAVVAATRRKRWLTPQQWANRELDSLENSGALQSGDSELVAREVSSILRDYLEMQFEISAPVQTTCELLHAVKEGEYIDAETAKRFGDLFALADQAKFAGLQLSNQEMQDTMNDARELVETVTAASDRRTLGSPAAAERLSHEREAV